MSYKDSIKPIYTKLLGNAIRERLEELNILQNQIGIDEFDGEVELLSETTVAQIIKGKRNMSFNASLAFQTALKCQTPKELFFSTDKFKIQLLSKIIKLILRDDAFEGTSLKLTLSEKLGNTSITLDARIADFMQLHQKQLFDSLSNFIPDFPEETTSYEIAEKVTDWLSEFACLISQF